MGNEGFTEPTPEDSSSSDLGIVASMMTWRRHSETFQSLMIGHIELAQVQGTRYGWYVSWKFHVEGEPPGVDLTETGAKRIAEEHARTILSSTFPQMRSTIPSGESHSVNHGDASLRSTVERDSAFDPDATSARRPGTCSREDTGFRRRSAGSSGRHDRMAPRHHCRERFRDQRILDGIGRMVLRGPVDDGGHGHGMR